MITSYFQIWVNSDHTSIKMHTILQNVQSKPTHNLLIYNIIIYQFLIKSKRSCKQFLKAYNEFSKIIAEGKYHFPLAIAISFTLTLKIFV